MLKRSDLCILFGALLAAGSWCLASEGPPYGQQPLVPPTASVKAWLRLKTVPDDAADFGLSDFPDNISGLLAFPVEGGKPKAFGTLGELNRVPRPEPYSSGVAVYATSESWALIHERSGSWFWVMIPEPKGSDGTQSDVEQPPSITIFTTENPYRDGEEPSHPTPDPDGWVIYKEIDLIEPLPGELLRVAPNLNAKKLGPVEPGYLKMIRFKGDWVLVQEPADEDTIPLEGDRSSLLKIRWSEKRKGWIRWRIPGPVPGSHQNRMRGKEQFGIID